MAKLRRGWAGTLQQFAFEVQLHNAHLSKMELEEKDVRAAFQKLLDGYFGVPNLVELPDRNDDVLEDVADEARVAYELLLEAKIDLAKSVRDMLDFVEVLVEESHEED